MNVSCNLTGWWKPKIVRSNFSFFCVCWAAVLRLACLRASGLFIETQNCLYGEGRAELADSLVTVPKFNPGLRY